MRSRKLERGALADVAGGPGALSAFHPLELPLLTLKVLTVVQDARDVYVAQCTDTAGMPPGTCSFDATWTCHVQCPWASNSHCHPCRKLLLQRWRVREAASQ